MLGGQQLLASSYLAGRRFLTSRPSPIGGRGVFLTRSADMEGIVRELALFAGAGGGILGGKLLGWRTVCAVEIDPYCREVLLRRQEEKHLLPFPVWDDVRTFDGTPWRGKVDVVSAGFPCQPFSVAGKRKGDQDERNMWPATLRILCEVRPRFALLENVPGLLAYEYSGEIFGGLAESGFDARWRVLSAAEVGAPHKRSRLWIVADAKSKPRNDSNRGRLDAGRLAPGRRSGLDGSPWQPEPDMDRVVDGLAYGVDRLKALGNGQVPQVAATAWKTLI